MASTDADVLWDVRRTIADGGRSPTPFETAERLGTVPVRVEEALRRLGEQKALILLPGTTQVWMAQPFSAVPTPYPVYARGRTYWGNCAWNALGVLVQLESDGRIECVCADRGEPMKVEVREGKLLQREGVMHLLVPRAHWFDDIGFT